MSQNLTSTQRATFRLVATAIRETKRKLEKQSKLGVVVDPAQLSQLGEMADRAQAIALGEEQADLFGDKGPPR